MQIKFPGLQVMQEVSYLVFESFFEWYFMVFALPIPAEWQILALRVQLDVRDPLFEEYICQRGYPECNRLRSRTEIRRWGYSCVCTQEAVWQTWSQSQPTAGLLSRES